MANFKGSCCISKETFWYTLCTRRIKKIFIFLLLSEFLIIFICKFASKDFVNYLKLHHLNIGIYLPASIALPKNYTQAISKHALKGFKLFQRIPEQDIVPKSPGVNLTWLETNPIYSRFQIKEVKHKKRVTVLVIVSSAPRRVDRRQAIRETWWTQCMERNKVVPECIFMTDYQKKGDPYYNTLKLESEVNGDIYFQHVPGGITFGIRMLNHMTFALKHYDFDYFMRVDDDYFFCFEQFLQVVPLPMVTNFHWGWVHRIPGITRPEESMIMFSNDVIQRFMKQDANKIICHPWADQMIGLWSNEINMTYLFRHDSGIHHHPPVSQAPQLRKIPNICSVYIAVHGTYPNDMRLFWKHRGTTANVETQVTLLNRSVIYPIRSRFEWRNILGVWNYKPKLCIENPTWDTSKQFVMGGAYSGREDVNKRIH